MVQRIYTILLISLGLVWFLAPAIAQVKVAEPFSERDLQVDGKILSVLSGDLSGDGLIDLVVVFRKGLEPKFTRHVGVFIQKQSGKFNISPDATAKVGRRYGLIDLGPSCNGEAGQAIYLLSHGGLYRWGFSPASGLGEPEIVLKRSGLSVTPDPSQLPHYDFVADWKGNGSFQAMLPGYDRLDFVSLDDPKERTEVVRVQPHYTSSATPRTDHGHYTFSIQTGIEMPVIATADGDGDGKVDLYLIQGEEIWRHRQGEDGKFSKNPTGYSYLPIRDEEERVFRNTTVTTWIKDINGDGKADILLNKFGGTFPNLHTTFHIHLGMDDAKWPAKPDFQKHLEGYSSYLRLVDVNGDGRLDLVMPHAKMGVTDLIGILLTKKVDVDYFLYLWPDGDVYQDKPDYKRSIDFFFDYRSGISLVGISPRFQGDFNADGRMDMVVGKDTENLQVYLGGKPVRKLFDTRPDGEMSCQASLYFSTLDLNDDRYDDIFVFYPTEPKMEGTLKVLINRMLWPSINAQLPGEPAQQ